MATPFSLIAVTTTPAPTRESKTAVTGTVHVYSTCLYWYGFERVTTRSGLSGHFENKASPSMDRGIYGGTHNPGMVDTTNCVSGECIKFNKDSYVFVPTDNLPIEDACLVNPTECRFGFSYSLFIKFTADDFSSRQKTYILNTASEGYGVSIYRQLCSVFVQVTDGQSMFECNLYNMVAHDTWFNLGFRWNRTHGLHAFLDGELRCNQMQASKNVTGTAAFARHIILGGHLDTRGKPKRDKLTTSIDELCIWNYDLSDSELHYFLGGHTATPRNALNPSSTPFYACTAEKTTTAAPTIPTTACRWRSGTTCFLNKAHFDAYNRAQLSSGNAEDVQAAASNIQNLLGAGLSDPATTQAPTTTRSSIGSASASPSNVSTTTLPPPTTTTEDPIVVQEREKNEVLASKDLLKSAKRVLNSPSVTSQTRTEVAESIWHYASRTMAGSNRMRSWKSIQDDQIKKKAAETPTQQQDAANVTNTNTTEPEEDLDGLVELLDIVDNAVSAIAQSINSTNASITLSTENIESTIEVSSKRKLKVNGVKLSGQAADIKIPPSLFDTASSSDDTKFEIIFTTYKHIKDAFPTDIKTSSPSEDDQSDATKSYSNNIAVAKAIKTEIKSEVISFEINPKPTTGVGINITFKTTGENNGVTTCNFWDPSLKSLENIYGKWNQDGIEKVWENDTHITCLTYHLTSFAILMQTLPVPLPDYHELPLAILSYVGVGISMAALLVFMAVLVKNKELRDERGILHLNLIIALLLSSLWFLLIDVAKSNPDFCKAVSVLMHYFYLVAFFLMFMEGLSLFYVIVYGISKGKLAIYLSVSWCVPLAIVGATLAVGFDQYGADSRCWLAFEGKYIWAFIGPVLLLIALNTIVMFIVICNLPDAATKKFRVVHKAREAVRNALLLVPLLGLTWVFGLLSLSEDTVVFAYFFVILNAFQGLFIFIAYGVGDKHIRKALAKILHKKGDEEKLNPSVSTASLTRVTPIPRKTKPRKTGGDISSSDTSSDDDDNFYWAKRTRNANSPVSPPPVYVP